MNPMRVRAGYVDPYCARPANDARWKLPPWWSGWGVQDFLSLAVFLAYAWCGFVILRAFGRVALAIWRHGLG